MRHCPTQAYGLSINVCAALVLGLYAACAAHTPGAKESDAGGAASSVVDSAVAATGQTAPASVATSPSSPAQTAAGEPSFGAGGTAANANQRPVLHAYLQKVRASFVGTVRPSMSAEGNALLLSDDPEACAHAAANLAASGSLTLEIFDPNFVDAAQAIGVSPGLASGHNVLRFDWLKTVDPGAQDGNRSMCADVFYAGTDAGVATFVGTPQGAIEVALPAALDGRPIDRQVSTCSAAIVAPARLDVYPNHLSPNVIFCAPTE